MWGLKDKEYLDPLTSALSHLGLRHPLLSHRLRLRRHNQPLISLHVFTLVLKAPQNYPLPSQRHRCVSGMSVLPNLAAASKHIEWLYATSRKTSRSLSQHRASRSRLHPCLTDLTVHARRRHWPVYYNNDITTSTLSTTR